ncbi:hypothetical protein [Halobacteriovorax sp. RT-2-6]|uniref:hypothetical protein n=1 Tax=unclassified Halobacteriovorax TaxID=2639665 RepID=UPI00399ACB16
MKFFDVADNTNHKVDLEKTAKKTKVFKNLPGIALVVIDENDQVIKVNSEFRKMFNNVNLKGGNWDDFFKKTFRKEKGLADTSNLFKNCNDILNDYIIHTSMDQSTGYRYGWIYKIPVDVMNKISLKRTALMESKKLDAYNFIEDEVFGKRLNWINNNLTLNDFQYADDCLLYANTNEAKMLLKDFVELLYGVLNLKTEDTKCSVEFSRGKNGLQLTGVFTNFNFSDGDFQANVSWHGRKMRLNDICKVMESRLPDLYTSIYVKNFRADHQSKLKITLNVNDIDGVRWHVSKGTVSDI